MFYEFEDYEDIDNESINENIFDSELHIADKVIIRVPIKILNVCKIIQSKVKHNEFSILCRSSWNKNVLNVSEDYVIPKQEVTGSSVDYIEDLSKYKNAGYNVIIHSHPFKSNSFSTDDIETINTHFIASILYSCGEFTRAVISLTLNKETKLQIDAEIEIVIPELEEEIDISNIHIQYPKKRFRIYTHEFY